MKLLVTLGLTASIKATAAANNACTGESAGLAPAECATWQDLHKSTNGMDGFRLTLCGDELSTVSSCRPWMEVLQRPPARPMLVRVRVFALQRAASH
jgi:hypothetical protein